MTQRRYKLLISALALSIVSIAGCRATSPPSVDAGPVVSAPAPEIDEGVEVLKIDPKKSAIRFTGEREEIAHTRAFAHFGGEVRLDEQGELIGVWVVLDVKSLVHGGDALSRHLLTSDFFDPSAFPTAGFKSSEVVKAGGDDHTHVVSGILEIRGTQREIRFPATIEVTGARLVGDAVLMIDRQDFGIDFPGDPDDPIEDIVPIALHLECPRGS